MIPRVYFKCSLQCNMTIARRKTYLLAIVEEEQRGISPYSVLRAHLVMLSAIHLDGTQTCALGCKFTE